ncbi:MAG: hypothetical protein LBF50_09615 [Azoarcus sp.]|jgi:hypothetical protein|nr:hypothetical protein [Azoarcus sp.]
MRVHLTYDVEIWCNGWKGLREKFPDAFQRYVYGPPEAKENGALPLNLKILQDNGLKAIFFVEPLFSFYFGLPPLQEIVGLILEAGQDVQLHLHPEWLDELPEPLLPSHPKLQHFYNLPLAEQVLLLELAASRLVEAGARKPTAFRAGNYAIDISTLKALSINGFTVDSSVNPSYPFDYPANPSSRLYYCSRIENIAEFPVTQFRDNFGKLRHLQINACSSQEMIQVLKRCHERGLPAATLVSHNFELLTANKAKIDIIVRSRFERLCQWLGKNAEQFECAPFDPNGLPDSPPVWEVPRVSPISTAIRYIEQFTRRILYN